jgi:hypothetical protein
MSTDVVKRGRGLYAFGAATLRTSWSWRRAEIRLGDRAWTVEPTDRWRIGVTASAGNGPAVRLHPERSHVPGPGGAVRWRPGHRGCRLTREGGSIDLRVRAFSRGPIRVDVTGTWPELDLVVLTAVFALMTRRRRRTLTAMAIAGAIGHGPVG